MFKNNYSQETCVRVESQEGGLESKQSVQKGEADDKKLVGKKKGKKNGPESTDSVESEGSREGENEVR